MIGKFQSFSTEKHNIQFTFTIGRKKIFEVTCILDSVNFYSWMAFIWYSCNCPFVIENNVTSASYIVETDIWTLA